MIHLSLKHPRKTTQADIDRWARDAQLTVQRGEATVARIARRGGRKAKPKGKGNG